MIKSHLKYTTYIQKSSNVPNPLQQNTQSQNKSNKIILYCLCKYPIERVNPTS